MVRYVVPLEYEFQSNSSSNHLVFKGPVYKTRKKDRNQTEQDQLGPDRWLWLRTFQIDGPRLRDWFQPILSKTSWLQGGH